jgi:hypothetical protein
MQDGTWTWGREGFYQGDALASRAHDCLLQQAAVEAGKECVEKMSQDDPDELWVIMFRDDIYVVSSPDVATTANDYIDTKREQITGVTENKNKTRVFIPSHDCHDTPTLDT